jgi:Mn-dependent DtxR family transcriptional regulator
MVIVAGLLYGISVFFAPEKGLLRKWYIRKQQNDKITREDILKWMLTNEITRTSDFETLSSAVGLNKTKVNAQLRSLEASGMVTMENDLPHLSLKGKEAGNEIVRAHRLWESFQVSKMGMKEEQIHTEADRMEHHLTPALVDEVEEKLGFPTTDPHGSPIPPRKNFPNKSLISLNPKQKGKIAKSQLNHDIEGELWEMGLMPETAFTLIRIEKDAAIISVNNKKLSIPAHIAKLVNIH